MENKTEVLTHLRAARAWLVEHYIQWVTVTPSGRGCASGALDRTGGRQLLSYVNAAAIALYPEYIGASAPRSYPQEMSAEFQYHYSMEYGRCFGEDAFDALPMVWVNNHLGKEATLAMFDAAILDLELALAPQPALEPVREGVVA